MLKHQFVTYLLSYLIYKFEKEDKIYEIKTLIATQFATMFQLQVLCHMFCPPLPFREPYTEETLFYTFTLKTHAYIINNKVLMVLLFKNLKTSCYEQNQIPTLHYFDR